MRPGLRPTDPGFVLGSFRHGRHGRKIAARVDVGVSHAMMIASPGGGRTAYFLYPNTEYAMACSVSFVTLDTKEDLSKITKKGVRWANYKTVCFL